ncbi:LysR substrate-binding domain-containing protein [Agrobacterium sp. NPDC058088]|uniref:LysR substrate-binding domain-containing protein n=1 Tax=Agrobacterium sp. NPDC058088 TaxID=3346335 RepID=UPI0036DF6010
MDTKSQKVPALELRHLRYFIALVEERNFERAAFRLGIAQPGLSQQILKLEEIVGVSLIDRARRSAKLTQSGHTLYEEALKIVAQADAAVTAIKRIGRGEMGRISVGYVASAAYSGAVVDSIREFRLEHPKVDVHLVEMELRQQLSRIGEGLLDFGFIRSPAPIPEGISIHVIRRERLILAVSEEEKRSLSGGADLETFANHRFLVPNQPRDVGFHATTIEACQLAGFAPEIQIAGFDFTGVGSMVAIGGGVALVPASLANVTLPGLSYIELPTQSVTSDIAVAYRKIEPSRVVRAFITQSRRIKP